MKMSEFEGLVDRAVKKMPRRFRAILKKEGIQLLARDKAPAVLQGRYRGGVVFGVFAGVSYDKRSVFNVETEPTRIELYKKSFETVFADPREMERQIVKTVIHEIGHYFGFSEKQLRSRGL